MSTVKLFSPEDWQQLSPEQHQVKVASGGLRPGDAQDALRFASPEVVHWLKNASLNPDCFYVHKLAMGGSHRYGPNRWGDGFREEVLENDCPTFVKNAKAYRQHKSRGPYFGSVKLARLRNDGVVELVTEYYGTRKVAEQHGGQVADREIESLMKKSHIPVSMGSLVPHDICVVCNTKAPKPKDRCRSVKEGGICPLFGCLNGMLKMASDGRINYVDNPINNFYDISMVGVGADPIANGVLLPVGDFYDSLVGHNKQAEFSFENLPDSITLTDSQRESLALLSKLAGIQRELMDDGEWELDAGYAALPTIGSAELRGLHSPNLQKRQDAFQNVIKSAAWPSFEQFAKSAGLSDPVNEQAQGFVPDVFDRAICRGLQDRVIEISENYKKLSPNRFAKFANGPQNRLDLSSVLRSALVHGVNSMQFPIRKTASWNEPIPDIAIKYAGLQLAVIAQKKPDPTTLCALFRREQFGKPVPIKGS